MIELKNISMKFNLGIEKGFSIKQGFVDLFNRKKRIEKKKRYIHCLSAGYLFNFYTYPSIEKMCQDILLFSSYLKQNQNASEAINEYLHKINDDGDYL